MIIRLTLCSHFRCFCCCLCRCRCALVTLPQTLKGGVYVCNLFCTFPCHAIANGDNRHRLLNVNKFFFTQMDEWETTYETKLDDGVADVSIVRDEYSSLCQFVEPIADLPSLLLHGSYYSTKNTHTSNGSHGAWHSICERLLCSMHSFTFSLTYIVCAHAPIPLCSNYMLYIICVCFFPLYILGMCFYLAPSNSIASHSTVIRLLLVFHYHLLATLLSSLPPFNTFSNYFQLYLQHSVSDLCARHS